MDLFEALIEGALAAIGGLVLGGLATLLVCTIVEHVTVRITQSNLGQLIRQALTKSREAKARELLGKALINGKIQSKTSHSVSVSLFDENNNEAVRLDLNSTQGVDDALVTGLMVH